MDEMVAKPIEPPTLQAALDRLLAGGGDADDDHHRAAEHGPAEPAADGAGGPPILDRDILGRRRNDLGDAVLAKLVQDFIRSARARGQTLRDTDPVADPEACERAAHALKSGAASLGLTALSERCREIEQHCSAGEPAKAADLRHDIGDLLAESEDAVQAYVGAEAPQHST